jgi:glycosyltransferase involved in cell wall biosynthesis
MNILLINHYAGSPQHGMEFRPYYMAREWVQAGHNVTIVAASFSHLRSQNPAIDNVVTEEVIDGIRYVWLKTYPYEGNGFGRIRNMLQFIWRLQGYVNKGIGINGVDAVIASSTYPLDVYAARRVQIRNNAHFVFEVHDLWPLSPMVLGRIPAWHPYIMVMQKAENDAYKFCDAVVSLAPCAKDHMTAHGLHPSKFNWIPNGIRVEDWLNTKEELPEDHNTLLTGLKENSYFIVGYAGTHGLANALEVLVKTAALMIHEKIAFVFVGWGPKKNDLIKQASNLKNVYFLDPVIKSAIPTLLSKFDVCYIGAQRDPLYKFGISPNKLIDYMMAGKPIINAIEAGNDPVQDAGCGITVPPENPQAIADAVRQLMALSEEERTAMGMRGQRYVKEHHDYKFLAAKFLKVLEG